VVVHTPMVSVKTLKSADRRGEARWRGWAVLLAVALGILAGAVEAGRIRFQVLW